MREVYLEARKEEVVGVEVIGEVEVGAIGEVIGEVIGDITHLLPGAVQGTGKLFVMSLF